MKIARLSRFEPPMREAQYSRPQYVPQKCKRVEESSSRVECRANTVARLERIMRVCGKFFARLTVVSIVACVIAVPLVSAQQSLPTTKLTLKGAVEMAVANSRDIAEAKLAVQLAQKNADVDRSQFRPNIYAGSGAAYTSGFPLAPGQGVPAIFELSYSQSIFNPLAHGQLRADEERASGQNNNVDAVRNSVMVRAASAYLELGKIRRSLDLLHKGRESAQKITDSMRQRVTAGYELPIEQTRAELAAAKIEQQIAQSEGRAETLADQLRDLLGLKADQPLELVDEDLPPPVDQPVADLVAQAIASDPGVKLAESEQRAKEDILKGTRGSWMPTISLVGTYSVLSKTNNYTEFFNKFERNNVVAGIQVQIPIFASRSNASVAVAQADASVAAMDVKNKRSQLELQVRSQARGVRETEMGKEVARLELKLAQQNLGVVQAQFDSGRSTIRELGQAQLDENNKWLAFLDADFQRQQSELTLLQLTGQVGKILETGH
jgi:outer membrane protein